MPTPGTGHSELSSGQATTHAMSRSAPSSAVHRAVAQQCPSLGDAHHIAGEEAADGGRPEGGDADARGVERLIPRHFRSEAKILGLDNLQGIV